MEMKCPCNSTVLYRDCCQIAHQNISLVKTAEQLMRSRYSAFVLADGKYLQNSHHSSTRPSKKENKATINWAKSVEWLKLEVISLTEGKEEDKQGTVTFKAYFFENGKVDFIEEKSLFRIEEEVFKYVDRIE